MKKVEREGEYDFSCIWRYKNKKADFTIDVVFMKGYVINYNY